MEMVVIDNSLFDVSFKLLLHVVMKGLMYSKTLHMRPANNWFVMFSIIKSVTKRIQMNEHV